MTLHNDARTFKSVVHGIMAKCRQTGPCETEKSVGKHRKVREKTLGLSERNLIITVTDFQKEPIAN